ncbi:hypothetical protein [Streptomyces sp. NPDC057682]|uniref:hypothetical protein n=1 Tax=Streptomyces sp. NPDC057682 TaxID=3346210 RepID=UPI0036A0537A
MSDPETSATTATPPPAEPHVPSPRPDAATGSSPRPERAVPPPHRPTHPVDRAFLGLERGRPDIRWDGGGVVDLTGPPPTLAELRAYVAHRVARLPLLTSRITDARPPRWRTDPGFAADRHVDEVVADGPDGADAALHTALNAPFAPDAYWGLWLIHGHAPDAYLLCYRFRHAAQDGGAAAMTFRALLGDGEPSRRPVPARGGWATAPRRAVVATGLAARFLARTFAGRRLAVAYTPTGERRFGRARVPADTLRRIGAARGGSAHDAHLAALAGALRTWADEQGVPLPRATALLPVDARRPEDEQIWGNRCFALPLDLPLGPSGARPGGAAGARRLDAVMSVTRKLRGAVWRRAVGDLVRHMPAGPTAWYMRRLLSPRVSHVMATSMPLADRGGLGESRVTGTVLVPLFVPGQLCAVGLAFYGEWAEVSVVADSGLPGADTLPGLWERAVRELEESVACR